jgi:hypothetical protein
VNRDQPAGTFSERIEELLADAIRSFGPAGPDDGPQPEYLIPPAFKHSAIVEVSEALLMDCGAIPDTREHKPIPWRTRFRWWRGEKRERAAELAYRAIAGHDAPEQDW